MNTIGILAIALFVVGWIGAATSFLAFNLKNLPQSVWLDPSWRKRFLIFVGFCALGPLSALIGFLFGDWPIQ